MREKGRKGNRVEKIITVEKEMRGEKQIKGEKI